MRASTEPPIPVQQPLLIAITGPVGGGKSTTSMALADSLRRDGVSVAVVDLDQMYGFIRQRDGWDDHTAWRRARLGAAALANAWFAAGVATVIIDGEFFDADELNTLLTPIHPQVSHCFFTLRVSYDQALVRVQGDPSRGGSKDPAILKSLHGMFARALPFLEETSLVIDTNALTQGDVVERLLAALPRQLLHRPPSAVSNPTPMT